MGLADGRFDVIIVGGRVGGCATAIHLVRAGLRVAVVERGVVPSDTLSTHMIQDLGLLSELGVLDEVLACGAPPLRATSVDLAGHDLSADVAHAPWLCLRRFALDEVLVTAVERVGATVLTQTSVIGLLRSADRVTGVTIQGPDGQRTDLRAHLVVGADGRNSTVARLVNAAKYDVVASERDAVWGYYRGLAVPEVFYFARRDRDIILTAACDQGLTLVASQPPRDDDRDWRDRALLERVAGELVPPLRSGLQNAELVGGLNSVRRMDGYFREATGPGWVLVGDSGHFKDVVVGQGICDALRQARAMTMHISAVVHDPDQLDAALRTWWRERDDDARPMYWLAQDLCRVEASVIDEEVWRTLAGSARYRRNLHQVLARHRPSRYVSGRPVQLQATVRAALRTSVSFSELWAGLGTGLVRERERKAAGRRPGYQT